MKKKEVKILLIIPETYKGKLRASMAGLYKRCFYLLRCTKRP